MNPPLHGIRVLDLTELLPGPYATKLLADLGATVVKIERPSGDGAQAISAPLYRSLNGSKQRVALDLKDAGDRSRFMDMAAGADVVVEAYRPGVAKRLGIDYERLSQANAGLVYASITGYGQNGPDAMRPGHDINYLAAAGILAISGTVDGGPSHETGLPVADIAGSMFAVTSILAALVQRASTSRGQFLDVSITDALVSWMTPRLGFFRGPAAESFEQGRFHILSRPAYGIFETADGRHITLAAVEDKFWETLAAAFSLSFRTDERCATYRGRQALAAAINAEITQIIRSRSAAEWASLFLARDIPFSIVRNPAELFDDPHLAHRSVLSPISDEAPDTGYPVPMTGIAPNR